MLHLGFVAVNFVVRVEAGDCVSGLREDVYVVEKLGEKRVRESL